MLMESARPGESHPFNKVKRPGVHKLFCLQTAACGSDTVQYFQWRKEEVPLNSIMVPSWIIWALTTPGFFRETAQVGELLKKIAPAASGPVWGARAAFLTGITAGQSRM